MKRLFYISAFEVESSLLFADPAYSYGSPLPVLSGKWQVSIIQWKDPQWGWTNQTLVALHESEPAFSLNQEQNFLPEDYSSEGVDSGQMGIYNFTEWKKSWGAVLNTRCYEFGIGLVNDFGVICSSGWGDGRYPVRVRLDANNQIVGAKIDFLEKKNDEV